MSQRNTFVRSLHDVGIAAWFGGALMGAVGLNGAAAAASDPRERLRLASVGWKKWGPLQLAAIAAHGVGSVGVIVGNKSRLASQKESRVNSYVKFALTLLALGSTLYSGILGKKMDEHSDEQVAGSTEPGAGTSDELAAVQLQQRIMQWVTPAITLVLIVLGAQQGEQQRPFAGLFRR